MKPLEFKDFSSFSELYLFLNTSQINNKYKYKFKIEIKPFLYYSDGERENDDFKEVEMEEIDSKENKTSYSYYFYILKDSSDLKGVILRLQTSYRYLTLQIRYGEQEYYYGNNVLYSILLGISLSLPNILFQIYRKFTKQRICPAFILANDIIYHFALGNLHSYPLHMGGNNSLWIGGISIVLYVIIFFCLSFDSKFIFNQLYYSLQEFEELPTIEEFIVQNKRAPPKIRIIVRASHIESREVLKEYAPFERDFFKKEYYVDINGRLASKETGFYDHTEINFRNINNYYADWKREDEGGGKI